MRDYLLHRSVGADKVKGVAHHFPSNLMRNDAPAAASLNESG
jgi:hypothetical protein